MTFACIRSVGTSVSPKRYTQQEVLDAFQIQDSRIRSLFLNSWIKHRHLTLPSFSSDGTRHIETQGALLEKHRAVGIEMGRNAILKSISRVQANCEDIRYLCCATSTGLLVPSLSAFLIQALGLRHDCARLDVVGMGCNAGLNALSAVTAWASTHPGELAVLVCVEVCSAAYVVDATMRTAVVNSLFGDGASAITVIADPNISNVCLPMPRVLRFSSCIIPTAIDTMRYDWDEVQGKFSFFLDQNVPYLIGAHAKKAVQQLLAGANVRHADIRHWIIHAGGKKVIDAVRVNLGLTRHDVRHTISVLRDYGNVSSGSYLFSYERLLDEGVIAAGDYGVMMTMGPGATIELALLYWPLSKES